MLNMVFLQVTILLFVAAAGTAVALTRAPERQIVGVSFLGLILALMFFIFQAPDVALSEIVVGAVALPLMVLLALSKIRRISIEQEKDAKKKEQAS